MSDFSEKGIENLLHILEECGPNSKVLFGDDPKNLQLQNEFEEYCKKVRRKQRLINEWNSLPENLTNQHKIPNLSQIELRLLENYPNLSQNYTISDPCRLCYNELSEFTILAELEPEIQELLGKVFTVCLNDGFSQNFCLVCLNLIRQFQDLRVKCQEANLKFFAIALQNLDKTKTKDAGTDLVLLSNVSEQKSQLNQEEEEFEENETFSGDDRHSEGLDEITEPIEKIDSENLNKKHVCDFCTKRFKTKLSLIVHIRTHTDERPFICKECGRRFKTNSAINNHKVVHEADKKFECQESGCNFRTTTKANLSIHMRTHTQERNYSCTECNLKFTTSSNLSKHIKNVHFKLKQHKCSQCDKMFFTKESARKHEITHSNLKPYSCPICPSLSYAWYNGLQKHLKAIHPGVKSETEKKYFDTFRSQMEEGMSCDLKS
uniref:CSON014642 protein n=1 Tax=Culicoides sonorensis TaxID=179676 RepID=A0A336KQW6_CULSO